MSLTKNAAELVMAYLLFITGGLCAWAVFSYTGAAAAPVRVFIILMAPPWAVCLYQFLFGMEAVRRKHEENAA